MNMIDKPTECKKTILRGGHLIDPSQRLDGVMDVAIENAKIVKVGDCSGFESDEIIELEGAYVSPGWIDIHVHVYGTLGFADPDSIGLYQGVTSYVEAGGPGIGCLDEFDAMLAGRTSTSLYVGPYLRPMGIIGLNYVEGDLRSYSHVPITAWLDFADKHPGLIRYLKVGAFEKGGPAPLHLAKGVAEMLGVPMYLHVGELTPEDGLVPTYDAFRIAQSGDIITHIYNGNIGNILDANGQVLDIVRDAQARGVIFDIGFGGYNFAWEIAEKGFEQGLKPDIISSDLQQFNIGGPVYSLAHVLGFFLHLGMSISDVIRCITMAPARSLRLADRAGSLRRGMPADITVFRVEEGSFDLLDAFQSSRTTSRRFVPQMVFKDGRRFECDFERALNERNWFPIVCEDHVPAQAAQLSSEQLEFLHALAASLAEMEWQPSLPAEIDLQMATQLQDAFHDAMAGRSISLRDALGAVYDCFIEEPFTVQIGLFLLRLERSFVLQRIENVSSTFKAVA